MFALYLLLIPSSTLRRRRFAFTPKAFCLYAEGVLPLRRRRFAFTPKAFCLYAEGVLPLRRRRFAFTPKAFANFSPGLERSDNPGYAAKNFFQTLKGLIPHMPNPFRVEALFSFSIPGFSLTLE